MSQTVSSPAHSSGHQDYHPERYIRPGAELTVYMWLLLLGLPALLLFLIYAAR